MTETKAKIDAWIVRIQNQERMVRQRALKELLEFCETDENLTNENAMEIFDSVYLCMIKCYSDKYEMCRSLACSIISEMVKYLEQNDYYLSLLVPVIAKRLAVQEVVEESEEMRLQLLQQLNSIINKYKYLNVTGTVRGSGDDKLLKPYNDIVDILKITLLDSYPAILKESCDVIKITAIASPSFHYRAETLAEPLIALLKHRHSPIKVAAIEALGVVCLNITSNGDMIKKIIKDLSPLLMDQNPFVRRECCRTGCLFLMKLKDRYSFFERIIPLVLCGLADETPDVHQEIQTLWHEAGELYYNENQTELQKLDIIDELPSNYPDYIKRPSIGCRALVQRSLNVLNIVLHEMEDWKEEVRLQATKLLMQIVIHSEDHFATKYYDINAVLCKTCNDQEAPIAKQALAVAQLIGRFVDQKTWSKYIFEELKLRQNKIGIVKCLHALYENSSDPDRFQNLMELSEILLESSVSHNNHEEFQTELIKLLGILIEGISADDEKIQRNIYITILKTVAVSFDNESIRSSGIKLLEQLVEKCTNIQNLSQLHSKYIKKALKTLDLLDQSNDATFEQVLILYGIICLCGFQKPFMDDLKSVIIIALEHCEAEGKIKIFSGIAMASLKWNNTIGVDDPNENFLMLVSFVNDLIAPSFVWHAGRTAESVRTMAAASLCSLTQGITSESSRKIVESLMVPLVALIDDNNIATRSYALKTFSYVGPLNYEHLKSVAPAILSRLDDVGSEVREKAAECLGMLQLKTSNDDDEDEMDLWTQLLKQILTTMMIHLESPELNLRNQLIKSISTLAAKYPVCYKDALELSTISQELKGKLP